MNDVVLLCRNISTYITKKLLKVAVNSRLQDSEIFINVCLKVLPAVFYPVLVEEVARISGAQAGLQTIKKLDKLGCIRPNRVYSQLRSLFWEPKRSKRYVENEIKYSVLELVVHTLESQNIRPFISFGTLLGYVREGDFLDHDLDLDLGIFYDESSCEQVYHALIKIKAIQMLIYEPDPWPCRIKISVPSISRLLTVDLIFFKKMDGMLVTYSRILDQPILRYRSHFELRRGYFGAQPVWVPDPPEIFLNENYPNWETKSENHHYILTSPLTDFRSEWIRLYTSLSIMTAILAKSSKLVYLEKLAMEQYSTLTPWHT